MEKENFDFEEFVRLAGEQLRQGKPFTGKDGVFTPLLKRILEASLEGELDQHLSETRENSKNRRNGRSVKNIKSSLGAFDVFTPRDRNSTFEPQSLPKRQVTITDDIDKKILALYASGMSYSDIQYHLRDLYGIEVSDGTITSITNRVLPEIKQWQNRPLETVYPVIWLDAMHFKVRVDGIVKSRAIYSILSVSISGQKEVLGIYFGENESSSFWRQVLNDLRVRGIEDICIACIDNLKGFAEAIEDMFPKTQVQLCLVHQMRNSMKYLPYKDLRACVKDLKKIYNATNTAMALEELKQAEEKWGKRYKPIFESWHRNWDRIATFFNYPKHIRKLIYTTNPIESYHRIVRKITKTKGAFTSDEALVKLIYFATCTANNRWKGQIYNWNEIRNELLIYFGDRINLSDTV